MLKITKRNSPPSSFLGAKTAKEVQIDKYCRCFTHLVPHHIRGSHQKRQANPQTSTTDSSRDSPSRVASHAHDDQWQVEASLPNTKEVSAGPPTAATHQPAKNHAATATEAPHKDAKHSRPNNTIASTLASGPRENEGEPNPSPNSTSRSVGTGLSVPDTISTSLPESRKGMPASTLFIIIGTAVLATLILGACIWACWGKQRREGRRRVIWEMTTKGAKSDRSDISSFEEAHLEKPRSSDAKMLKSIRGKRLRGDSLSQTIRKDWRGSALWGSGAEIYDYPLETKYPDTEKDKQKSPYDNLDFGTMSTFETSYPPDLKLPPIAHYSEADHRYVAENANSIGIDGGRHEAYGNANGWDEVGHEFSDCSVDPMPKDFIQLQSYLPKQSFSYLNDHQNDFSYSIGTANLPVPQPARFVNSSARAVGPEASSFTSAPPNPTAASARMTPSEASKELEYMVNRLAQDLQTRSSIGGRGNFHD